MKPPHPWHHVPATRAEQQSLRDLEQQLIAVHGDTAPAGRIIRMMHGAAHLLRSAGLREEALVSEVERACHLALAEPASEQRTPDGRRHVGKT